MLDTEPLFLSNESTIWDFDLGTAEDIQQRCSVFAGRVVERHELALPLWQLIPLLSSGVGLVQVPKLSRETDSSNAET